MFDDLGYSLHLYETYRKTTSTFDRLKVYTQNSTDTKNNKRDINSLHFALQLVLNTYQVALEIFFTYNKYIYISICIHNSYKYIYSKHSPKLIGVVQCIFLDQAAFAMNVLLKRYK